MQMVSAAMLACSLIAAAGCKSASGNRLQDLGEGKSYDLASEAAARRAATGTWLWTATAADAPETLATRAMSANFSTANYRVRNMSVTYRSGNGLFNTELKAVNIAPANAQVDAAVRPPAYFLLRTSGYEDSSATKLVYLNNFFAQMREPMQMLQVTGYLLSGIMTLPSLDILIKNVRMSNKQEAVIKGGKLDARSVLSLNAAKTLELRDAVNAVVESNPEAEYLNTIVERKIRQDIVRLKLANLFDTSEFQTLGINRSNLVSGTSFVTTYQVDLDNLTKSGADFLLINVPNGRYKMTVFPQMVIEIAWQGAAKNHQSDWAFRNTFTRTKLVDPNQKACETLCFSTPDARDRWDSYNLKKFNLALTKIVSLMPPDVARDLPALNEALNAMLASLADVIAPATEKDLATTEWRSGQAIEDPADEAKRLDSMDLFQLGDAGDLAAEADPDASHADGDPDRANGADGGGIGASSSGDAADAQPSSSEGRSEAGSSTPSERTGKR